MRYIFKETKEHVWNIDIEKLYYVALQDVGDRDLVCKQFGKYVRHYLDILYKIPDYIIEQNPEVIDNIVINMAEYCDRCKISK